MLGGRKARRPLQAHLHPPLLLETLETLRAHSPSSAVVVPVMGDTVLTSETEEDYRGARFSDKRGRHPFHYPFPSLSSLERGCGVQSCGNPL